MLALSCFQFDLKARRAYAKMPGGNMKTLRNLVVLLVGTFLSSTARTESNCGSLEERLLFGKQTITEPAEYPWIGILFNRTGPLIENARCNVVIVGESHVLTPASCVRKFADRPELIAVRLGIWNETHQPDEDYICNDKGFCVPGPVQHLVSGIQLHPRADKDTGDNDLAILRLSERIKMTAYMQPLCLQPVSEPASWIDRNFHYGGFDNSQHIKGKGRSIVISRQYCTELRKTTTPPPENQFCGYPVKRTRFYNGAPLLGLNVEKDIPRSFYLVGFLVKAVEVRQTTIFIFQDIKPLRRWIIENTRSAST